MLKITFDKVRPVCSICGKKIEVDLAFMLIQGTIIIDGSMPDKPVIFQSWEHAANYSMGYYAHTVCWQNELRNKGIQLYDITEKKRRDKNGMGKNKSRKR